MPISVSAQAQAVTIDIAVLFGGRVQVKVKGIDVDVIRDRFNGLKIGHQAVVGSADFDNQRDFFYTAVAVEFKVQVEFLLHAAGGGRSFQGGDEFELAVGADAGAVKQFKLGFDLFYFLSRVLWRYCLDTFS